MGTRKRQTGSGDDSFTVPCGQTCLSTAVIKIPHQTAATPVRVVLPVLNSWQLNVRKICVHNTYGGLIRLCSPSQEPLSGSWLCSLFWPGALVHMTSQQKNTHFDRVCMRTEPGKASVRSPQAFLPASRSCTTRTATGTRAVSAAPSATSRWPRSPSAPAMTARSCAASAEPARTGTVARAATRWSCQVSLLIHFSFLFFYP